MGANVLHLWCLHLKSNGEPPNRHPSKKYLQSGMPLDAAEAVEAVYRSDWGRIVATLIRLVGDFDLAEECGAGSLCGRRGPVASLRRS